MKKLLLSTLFGLLAIPAFAANPYSIILMGTEKQYAFFEGGWKRGTECIEAKVSTDALIKKENMVIKAYFYGDSGEPIHVAQKPTSVVVPDGSTMFIPMEIEKGKKHEFYFGIPAKLAQGPNKWKRVIVVFGDNSQITARIYPKDDLAGFNFPEKSQLKQ